MTALKVLCHCEFQEHVPDILTSTRVGEAEEGWALMSSICEAAGRWSWVGCCQDRRQ